MTRPPFSSDFLRLDHCLSGQLLALDAAAYQEGAIRLEDDMHQGSHNTTYRERLNAAINDRASLLNALHPAWPINAASPLRVWVTACINVAYSTWRFSYALSPTQPSRAASFTPLTNQEQLLERLTCAILAESQARLELLAAPQAHTALAQAKLDALAPLPPPVGFACEL